MAVDTKLLLRRNDPRLSAGSLDRRVTLARPQYSEFGDEIIGWEAVADVWAAVLPESRAEINESARVVGVTDVTVIIRYRADVDLRWRIDDHGKLYEIIGLADVARRRVQLQLTCQEIQ